MEKSNFVVKLESLPTRKKVFLLLCLVAIVGSLLYMMSLDNITTISYKNVNGDTLCVETYVNGDIEGNYCPQNKHHISYAIDQWATENGINNVTG